MISARASRTRATGGEGWGDGVLVGCVDGAFLVEVVVGEIEGGVAEDGFVEPGLPVEFGAEDADGLEVVAAVEPGVSMVAEEGADVVDVVLEAGGAVFALDGVHLVPEVPGEEGAGAGPAAGGEFEALP